MTWDFITKFFLLQRTLSKSDICLVPQHSIASTLFFINYVSHSLQVTVKFCLVFYCCFLSFFHIFLVLVGWLVVFRINVDLAIFQPYLDLEAGDNQSRKIQVARPGMEPRSSCSASQELNHSATAAPYF